MKLFILIVALLFNFCEYSQAESLGYLIHQYFSENPCWVLNKVEIDDFINRVRCQKNIILNKNGLYIKDIFQNMVFDLAVKRKNNQALCQKELIEATLRNKDSNLYKYWINVSGNFLASYVLLKRQASDSVDIRSLLAKHGRKLRNNLENFDTDRFSHYEKEYEEALNSIQFSNNPSLKEQLILIVEETFGKNPSTYPSDFDKIKNKLDVKLKAKSTEILLDVLIDYDKYHILNNKKFGGLDSNDKIKIFNEGHVSAVIEELYPNDSKLLEKFVNCVGGDYGVAREFQDFIKNFTFSFAGGAYLTFIKLQGKIKLLRDLKNLFYLGFNSISVFFLKDLPETAIRSCFKKYPETVSPEIPEDCSGKMVQYNFEKAMEVQDCLSDAISVLF